MKEGEYKSEEKKLNLVEELKKKFGKNFFIKVVVLAAFLSLSAQKGEAQNQSKTVIKNEIPVDAAIQKEFEDQKEFLVDWFSNRIIPDEDLQKKFEDAKPHILKNLETVFLKGDTLPFAIGMWHNDTISINAKLFNRQGDPFYGTSKNTLVHELSHDAFPMKKSAGGYHPDMPEWMLTIIQNAIEKSLPDDSDWQNKSTDMQESELYLRTPEEIYAHICAFRKEYNLRPNQIITEKDCHLEEWPKDKNVRELRMIISDPDILIDLLNKLP